MHQLPGNANYQHLLSKLKEKIQLARTKAILTVNAQLLAVYWEIGMIILEQQQSEGWGAKIIDRLAADLKIEFPDETGFSVRNLKYMRAFAEAYPDFIVSQPPASKLINKKTGKKKSEIVQVPLAQFENSPANPIVQGILAQLSWYHHITLLDKVKNREERIFYIQKTIENGWSRAVMVMQIEHNLYESRGKAINNFEITMPAYESDLAKETFKSPYIFDFLTLAENVKEKEIERALIQHLKKFMRELGRGFAYVGNQFNLKVEDDDYFLDLLFYNIHLHCYVVFELKIGDFKPEYAGKLNFYINTVDEEIKGKEDKPTIGILLCKTPNDTVVKYALKGIKTPLGIAEYEFAKALPKQLKRELPSIEELETELEKEYEELKSPSQKRFESIKQKLSKIKGDGIKQVATTEILYEIIDKSVLPLYKSLIQRINEYKGLFYSNNYSWKGKSKDFTDINELAENWKNEEFLKSNYDFPCWCWLNGLKKAGTETFNIAFSLTFKIDTYWYGFTFSGANNQQPVIKKLYHEQLSKEEIESIIDLAANYVMDNIEHQIERLKKQDK